MSGLDYVSSFVEDNSPAQVERDCWLARRLLERYPDLGQRTLERPAEADDGSTRSSTTSRRGGTRAAWLLDMVRCLAMSAAARDNLFRHIEDRSPEQVEHERWLTQRLLERRPDVLERWPDEAVVAKKPAKKPRATPKRRAR